jgi:hypothetical protein
MPESKIDRVLSMLGVGKQLWEREPGDRFIERLRSEDAPPPPSGGQPRADRIRNGSGEEAGHHVHHRD